MIRLVFDFDTTEADEQHRLLNEQIHAIEKRLSDLSDQERVERAAMFEGLPVIPVDGRDKDESLRLVRYDDTHVWLARGNSRSQVEYAPKFERATGKHLPHAGPKWFSSLRISDLDALERAIAGGEE